MTTPPAFPPGGPGSSLLPSQSANSLRPGKSLCDSARRAPALGRHTLGAHLRAPLCGPAPAWRQPAQGPPQRSPSAAHVRLSPIHSCAPLSLGCDLCARPGALRGLTCARTAAAGCGPGGPVRPGEPGPGVRAARLQEQPCLHRHQLEAMVRV